MTANNLGLSGTSESKVQKRPEVIGQLADDYAMQTHLGDGSLLQAESGERTKVKLSKNL